MDRSIEKEQDTGRRDPLRAGKSGERREKVEMNPIQRRGHHRGEKGGGVIQSLNLAAGNLEWIDVLHLERQADGSRTVGAPLAI